MSEKDEFEGVWVFAEQDGEEIHPVSYELLGKGKELSKDLGTNLCCVFLTPNGENVEELIHRGADKAYLLESNSFNTPDELTYMKNIAELAKEKNPEILLIGATKFGRSLGPRIAANLRTGLTADCTGLRIKDGEFIQIRPAFTGNILAHIKTDGCPKMSTVRYKEFEEAERDTSREGEIIEMEPFAEVSERSPEIEDMIEKEAANLREAEIIVSCGRGLDKAKDIELVKELAEVLDAELGVSRPLVDDDWIDKEHQVGYSGKRVKPRIYIACGISGASQHLAGMKESDTIIAINTDPSAPIFDYSDYGIVGDLYEVIPELIDKIKTSK